LDQGLPELSSADGFVYQLDRVHFARVRAGEPKRATVRILVFTKLRWLDVVFLRVREDATRPNCCLCSARSFSTGLLPLTVRCAPLLNVLLCIAPFFNWGMPSRKTLPEIRRALQGTVEDTVTGGCVI
jgi:hypothetical protein